MAIEFDSWYTLTLYCADDSQGRQLSTHSVGIVGDTGTPGTDDPLATTLGFVDAYITAFNGISTAYVEYWILSREGREVAGGAIPSASDVERKATFTAQDVTGRRSDINIPSLDESLLETSGFGVGNYIDMTNGAVTNYATVVGNGNYTSPRTGRAYAGIQNGKKTHKSSGYIKDKVG